MTSLVCLSGGLDSAVAAIITLKNERCCAVSFDYGQPHKIELEYARKLAKAYGMPYENIGLPTMPKINDVVFSGRNMVLVSHAVSMAARDGHSAVVVGCNKSDWERFPDCRPDFWDCISKASAYAYGVSVKTPLLHMSKTDVVKTAVAAGLSLDDTWSCYDPQDSAPCGVCLACTTRIGAVNS